MSLVCLPTAPYKFFPRLFFCLAILFLAFPSRAEAQTTEWVEQPFFVKAMGQYYFHPYSPEFAAPDFLGAWPGFRAALGYEWRRFGFSLESGLSRFEGANPYRIYVEDITMFPLLFKFGYTFALPKGFGIQPEAGFGAVFYKTIHDSTKHSGPRNMQESFTTNMMASARLNLVWEIPKAPFLRLHVGGGADMIPETGAPIFMPVIEAGITFKPRLPRRIPPPPPIAAGRNYTFALTFAANPPELDMHIREMNGAVEVQHIYWRNPAPPGSNIGLIGGGVTGPTSEIFQITNADVTRAYEIYVKDWTNAARFPNNNSRALSNTNAQLVMRDAVGTVLFTWNIIPNQIGNLWHVVTIQVGGNLISQDNVDNNDPAPGIPE
jgi:hypothetical protein